MLTEEQARELLQRRKAIRKLGTPQAKETMNSIDRQISAAVRSGKWPSFTRADSTKLINKDQRPISRPPAPVRDKWGDL